MVRMIVPMVQMKRTVIQVDVVLHTTAWGPLSTVTPHRDVFIRVIQSALVILAAGTESF